MTDPDKRLHALKAQLKQVCEKCTSCKLCQRECTFLQQYGKPKEIAEEFQYTNRSQARTSFECSLCGLCTAVCPFGADPKALFLAIRRYAVDQGWGEFNSHARLRAFEDRGVSSFFSYGALPSKCSTVLFPRCALAGTRAKVIKKLFCTLRKQHPSLGLVLDCCSKPSHDLGRHDTFNSRFQQLREFLVSSGVQTVLVACPSCHSVFSSYGTGLTTRTVYEELADLQQGESANQHLFTQRYPSATFHDSCSARFETETQQAVRRLAQGLGLNLQEMPHAGKKALCCGEGGGACFIQPDFIQNWRQKRDREASATPILTYCAGCANFIGSSRATHILDLLFSSNVLRGKAPHAAKAPFTYLHRLALKRWAKKHIEAATLWRR